MPRRLGSPHVPRVLLALLFCALFVGPASAQVITSAVRGTVTDADDGTPIALADVTLVHVPSGNTKTVQSNDTGDFAFTGLRVGGPYTITVASLGFQPFEQGNIFLTAGKTRDIAAELRLSGEIIEITVEEAQRNASAKTVVGAEEIGELPSIGRDPKDVARLTPGAYTEGSNKALSIDGTNNRFNSVTVDGTRQDDDFGLNASGYPTRRSPVALSAVEQVAVETSPFDVRYGRFLGGNVNIVTKTGTNDFSGQVLATYANDSLVGDKSRDNELKVDFSELRLGATVGGPIVKNKLHFLASIETLTATAPVDAGSAGSTATNPTTAVSDADLARIIQIAKDVYGYDAGVAAKSIDENDLKLLAKLDWAINNKHRASVSYQRTRGNAVQNTGSSSTLLRLSSHWYDAEDTLHTVAARVFSDWTDKVSTELEVSGKIVDNRQRPIGEDFAEMRINLPQMDGPTGQVRLGPDEFRHANELDNDTYHARGQINVLEGNHLFTAGLEMDTVLIDNLFVNASRGVATYNTLAAFEARTPANIRYNNALTHNPDDAAAKWDHSTIAGYLQDQFEATPDLTIQAGLRLEGYHASHDVVENPNFKRRYGFSNNKTLDGKGIILPRLGVSYRPLPRLNLRGGIGLYSGGTPAVWVSNSYTNDGMRIDTETNSTAAIINGFDGRTIPDALKARLVRGDGNVDAIDPHFRIPSSWKLGLGADYAVDIPGLGAAGKDLEIKLNYTYSKVKDAVIWHDLRRNLDLPNNLPTGTLPDGRPYYDHVAAGGQFNPFRGVDMMLDNTDQGRTHAASIAINKKFPFGLSFAGSYAYTDATEVSPATSSRSVSNYGLIAVSDPENPEAARSNYERTHRFMGVVQFSRNLVRDIWPCCSRPFADMRTTISLFVESRSGQPFSYTFAGAPGPGDTSGANTMARIFGEASDFSGNNRQLFYVPKGDGSDVILNGIDPAEFDAFLKARGLDKYRGQIAPRNAFTSSWLNRFDMRISQDLPSPYKGHRARFVLDIENLGNLLNNDWGRFTQVGFPFMVPAVNVDYDTAQSKYVYSNLRLNDEQRVDVLQSVWRMSVGLLYDF